MKPGKIIGIAGGLGPFAHVDFERKLLDAAKRYADISSDQDYPEWIVSSVPATPDRTEAIVGEGEDPGPWLLRSLKRLRQAGADFACVPCNTAHRFLPALDAEVGIPILDMIEFTVEAVDRLGASQRIGVLATTGTLVAGVYHDALREAGHKPFSPLDLPEGEECQRAWVMDPVYGGPAGPGIKAEGPRVAYAELFETAIHHLAEQFHTNAVIAGCSEIPLALTGDTVNGIPLIDPTRLLAERAIQQAYGLDSSGSSG